MAFSHSQASSIPLEREVIPANYFLTVTAWNYTNIFIERMKIDTRNNLHNQMTSLVSPASLTLLEKHAYHDFY